jgi:predicted methyltransferase
LPVFAAARSAALLGTAQLAARAQQSASAVLDAALAGTHRSVTPTALNFFTNELEIAPAGSADLVVTFRNVHNWFQEGYGPPNAAELAFKAMFDALKPGGVLGVVDHRWPDRRPKIRPRTTVSVPC